MKGREDEQEDEEDEDEEERNYEEELNHATMRSYSVEKLNEVPI